MASVDLHLHEVDEAWLPPVCARCGDRACCCRAKTVVWLPWWMLLLVVVTGFLILVPFVRVLFVGALDMGRRVTIHLPFCEKHRNHWRWRSWPLVGLLTIALGLITAGIAMASVATRWDPRNEMHILGRGIADIGIVGSCIGVLCLVAWAPLAMILPYTAIRVSDLAGSALTLNGVDEAFCDAVAERRLKPTSEGVSLGATTERDDHPRGKRQKTCDKCGQDYSPRRLRCPNCGEANDAALR
jgi:hypothetical protein